MVDTNSEEIREMVVDLLENSRASILGNRRLALRKALSLHVACCMLPVSLDLDAREKHLPI